MAVWDTFLTERDRQVFQSAGYGREMTVGKKPALLVIDVTYEFVGLKPEPILEAIKTFPTACGEEGWAAVKALVPLLKLCREKGVPVMYTTVDRGEAVGIKDPWSGKKKAAQPLPEEIRQRGKEIVDEIKPLPGEIVLSKHAPSAFFGTPLLYYLRRMNIDTLIIAGCTTSGCVRATATDSFSYGFANILAAECVFDRGQASHAINLFDMQAKFANLWSCNKIEQYLKALQ